MNKQAFDKAYAFGVQKALRDSGLIKESAPNPLVTMPLAGAGLGAGIGAGIGLANRDEGDIFGRGEESRLAAALKGGAIGGGIGGGLGLAGDVGLVALALRGLNQSGGMGRHRIPITTAKNVAGGYL
jgi:hypothetical protein